MSGWLWKDSGDVAEQQARIEQVRQGTAEKEFELQRKYREDEAGLTDKDIQLKGLTADIATTEANYQRSVQAEKQGLMTAQLHDQTVHAKLTQSANIYRAFISGHKNLAIQAASSSDLVNPGQKVSNITIDDSDQNGPDGKPIKMFTLHHGEGEKPTQVPLVVLQRLEDQLGAQYKVVDKSLVRISTDGKITPVYEPDQFAPNTETGVPFSKRTGQPAAGGVRLAPGAAPAAATVQPRAPAAAIGTGLPPAGTTLLQPGQMPPQSAQPAAGPVEQAMPPVDTNAPPLTRKQETHVDTRVTQGTSLVNHYFGINSFTQLDPKNQPKYMKINARMGQLVRSGQTPEAATASAIGEVERAEKLGQGGAPGAYTGPTPWRSNQGAAGYAKGGVVRRGYDDGGVVRYVEQGDAEEPYDENSPSNEKAPKEEKKKSLSPTTMLQKETVYPSTVIPQVGTSGAPSPADALTAAYASNAMMQARRTGYAEGGVVEGDENYRGGKVTQLRGDDVTMQHFDENLGRVKRTEYWDKVVENMRAADALRKRVDDYGAEQEKQARTGHYAGGGMVRGKGGKDKVPAIVDGKQPARLTSGEGVLNRAAMAIVGPDFLNRLNKAALKIAPPARR